MNNSVQRLIHTSHRQEYIEVIFEDPNNRRWFEKKYGFKVYKPKRYLVVGRRNDFECDEWIEIKSDYTDVEIVTYDDLVDTVVPNSINKEFSKEDKCLK